jgi:hypothetical protein
MYRNLEEDRRKKIEAAGESTEAECQCTCTKGTETSQADKPAGDRTTEQVALHYKING